MPVRRSLRMENSENQTPAKSQAADRHFSPITGTARLPAAGNVKPSYQKAQGPPQTDVEKLSVLRSKMEASAAEFTKARRELEEIVSAEGSSELSSFFSREDPADLKTELRRHSQLASKAESCLKVNDARQSPCQVAGAGSSYEFLKSIM